MHQNQAGLNILTSPLKLRLAKDFPVIEITASDTTVKRWCAMALQNKNWTKNAPCWSCQGINKEIIRRN